MRRIRNPRYAPEFLERKLSPSGLLGAMPPAEFAPLETGASSFTATPEASNTPSDYADPGDELPIDPVPPPDPDSTEDPLEPGDPLPTDPVPPEDPTGPEDPFEPGDPIPVEPVPPPDPSGPA